MKAKSEIVEAAAKKRGRPPGYAGMSSITKRNYRYVQKMFQEHEQQAMEVMVEIMQDVTVDPPVRLKAANDILNRARGTPVSTSVVISMDESEERSNVNPAQIGRASTEELQAVLATLQNFLESESKMVDVTPENE